METMDTIEPQVHIGDFLEQGTKQFWEEQQGDDDDGKQKQKQPKLQMEMVFPAQIWVVRNVLSKEECQELIKISEKIGYDEATITGFNGGVMMKSIRNNMRIFLQDEKYSAKLFERLRPFIPETHQYGFQDRQEKEKPKEWKVVGLNERFRFYKYHQGQYFKKHFDGCFVRNDNERSFVTLQIYLNDDFKGGATTFFDQRFKGGTYDVKPETGMAIFFFHDGWLHCGSELIENTKYVIRSDVMYRSN